MDTSGSLTQLYDDLKSSVGRGKPKVNTLPISTPGGELAWRNKAATNAASLTDKCRKHILVDIYCKIIPLDDNYVAGHQGQMKTDVDNMLATKGMTATQYLTSCYESTKAPLLDFILRSTNLIGKSYMEDANDELKDAKDTGINIGDPKEAEVDDDKVEEQLVDITKDSEYETFIDSLKKKTINKIVSDVSDLINNKKEEKDMTFDPNPEQMGESTVSVAMDYIQKKLFRENVDFTDEQTEQMIGMAVREATLHQFDVVFNQHERLFKEYVSKINYGKGAVINESTIQSFISSSES